MAAPEQPNGTPWSEKNTKVDLLRQRYYKERCQHLRHPGGSHSWNYGERKSFLLESLYRKCRT